MSDLQAVAAIRRIISGHRWSLENEIRLHDEMAVKFREAGLSFEREVRLSRTDHIDFLISDVGVEVKIKGSKRSIYKQIERYARCGRLARVVLVSNVALGLPADIDGVPVDLLPLTGALA